MKRKKLPRSESAFFSGAYRQSAARCVRRNAWRDQPTDAT